QVLMKDGIQIYAMGAKTAAAVKGFAALVVEGVETSRDLAEHCASVAKKGTRFWLAGARDLSAPWEQIMLAAAMTFEHVILYETDVGITNLQGSRLSPDELPPLARAVQQMKGVVCFASPSAVTGFSALFRRK